MVLLTACYATPRQQFDRAWTAAHADVVYRIVHHSDEDVYVGTVTIAGVEHAISEPRYAEGVFTGHYRYAGERRDLHLVYVDHSGSGAETVVVAVEERSGAELVFRRER